MESDAKAMNTKELTHAVNLLLEREEARNTQRRRRARRHVRHRREELEAAIAQLAHSTEVIKRCILGITAVIVFFLLFLIYVVVEVEKEAERIKFQVQEIQREAEMIRDKIRHPLESLGGTLGRRMDSKFSDLIGPANDE